MNDTQEEKTETKEEAKKAGGFTPLVPADLDPSTIHETNTLVGYAHLLDAKLRLCATLKTSGMVPSSFKTPGDVLACILIGQEFGFTPMISLTVFDPIEGRPAMRVAGMLALVQKAGGYLEVIEENSEVCTIRGTRGDRTYEYTFTYAMAEEMGFTRNGQGELKKNWRTMKSFMLHARCASVVMRRLWGDVVKGLYSWEELNDSRDADEPESAPKKREPVWTDESDTVPGEEKPKHTPELDNEKIRAAAEKARGLLSKKNGTSAPRPTHDNSGLAAGAVILPTEE